jgi:acyl-CoA hydrolase
MATATTQCSLSHVASQLRPGMTAFIPGMSGESLAFYGELLRDPQRAAGVTFAGVHFPGINKTDYLGLHPTCRQRAYFMSPAIRGEVGAGRVDLMPLDYPGIVRDLERNVAVDIVVAQVSMPDDRGMYALGASYDFLPSVWHSARLRVLHINPRLPRTRGSFAICAEDAHLAFESEADIPTLSPEPIDETTRRHAALVASLINDGDTLQFGIGRLQAAILIALSNHRRLSVYSGMVSSPIMRLVDSGVIRGERAIQAGVALGDPEFYARISADDTFYFRPVSETHDIRRLSTITDFCAINSALSVDLFGQANAECVGRRLVAGAGGLPAFAAAARLCIGGRSIIVLPATADGGKVSRIVAVEDDRSLITLPRHEADFVVTEFGIADLRARDVFGRARALIAIAAPQFREGLAAQWHKMAGLL